MKAAAGTPIAEDLRELSRTIVTKVARETASILHTRNDLGALDDPIDEAEFCDEAEALATGEECGCLEPDESIEGSLMVWVENSLRERVSASEERERVLRDAANEFRDAVLNQRGWFEEPCLDNDQTNSVLGAFDDTIGAALATPAPEQPAPLTVEVTEDGNVLVEDSARNLSVLALTEPLRITCPWDKQVWRFHTQEQADLFQKHLDWHAHSEQAEQPKGQQ